MALSAGTKAPAFRAKDQDGKERSSDEFAGRRFVLYFYPHDSTPICTREACSFQDSLAAFDDLGVPVVGVSADSVGSHKRFAARHDLRFALLSDPERRMIGDYGAKALFGRTARVTYIIGPDGTVEAVHRSELNGAGHAKWVAERLRRLVAAVPPR